MVGGILQANVLQFHLFNSEEVHIQKYVCGGGGYRHSLGRFFSASLRHVAVIGPCEKPDDIEDGILTKWNGMVDRILTYMLKT